MFLLLTLANGLVKLVHHILFAQLFMIIWLFRFSLHVTCAQENVKLFCVFQANEQHLDVDKEPTDIHVLSSEDEEQQKALPVQRGLTHNDGTEDVRESSE